MNRTDARFCRQCGVVLGAEPETAADNTAATLRLEPAISPVDEAILTAPQSAIGFLWALGEEGSLYRVNPFEVSGRQTEVRTRFWAGPQHHAFAIRRLRHQGAQEEACALVATASGVAVWGLVSQHLDRFEALLDGESVVCDARSAYGLVDGAGAFVFCLLRRGGATSLARITLPSMTAERLPIAAAEPAVCGPVCVDGRVVVWSATELWTLNGDALERLDVPAGVRLWTGPSEDGILRLPLGRSPAIVSGTRLYLPCNQQGGPALLLLQVGSARPALSVIPVSRPGTLAEDTEGNPLFCTNTSLAICQGGGFRTKVHDEQLSGHFTAFHRDGVSVFFCESGYGNGTQQWLKARVGEQDHTVAWRLGQNQRLKDCVGFWMVAGGVTAQMLIEDRFVRTEFVSWHD